jgi:hypothetical protein
MGVIYFVFITGLLPVCSGNRVVATTVAGKPIDGSNQFSSHQVDGQSP